MKTVPHVPPDAHALPPCDPERTLLCVVLTQAVKDLRSPDSFVQASARRFFRGGDDLAQLCDLLGLDWRQVQRCVLQRFPQVLPRQLELALPEAS
jgi:hypothetical protein